MFEILLWLSTFEEPLTKLEIKMFGFYRFGVVYSVCITCLYGQECCMLNTEKYYICSWYKERRASNSLKKN
jgi:hypothetical protein